MAQTPKFLEGPNVTREAVRVFDQTQPSPVFTSQTHTPKTLSMGKKSRATKIGFTLNDQQTNASIYRHVQLLSGGKVSATWTTSLDAAPYAQRGSGYNHFNGTSWGAPTANRIEPERTGFPCYVYNPTTNEEIITSHIVKAGTGIAGGLIMNRKTGVGPGTWTSTTILDTVSTMPGVLWNQTAVAGDYLIVIASYTDSSSASQAGHPIIDGIKSPQVYSRYQFSTNTWLVKNALLPGYDKTRVYAGGGDNYNIDAKGNTVAILIGGLTDDLALWKSADAGATWTKTIIDSFPVAAYNYKTLFDTAYTNDGSVSVSIDAAGMAHCFWGLGRVMDVDTNNTNVSYFPGQNAIKYWKEGTALSTIKTIAGMPDENNNGTLDLASNWNDAGAKYGNNSIATMPSSAIGSDGIIYLIYSSLTEDDVSTDSRNYRDIYCVYSRDGGTTWSGITNLTSWLELNVEQIFGSVSNTVDNRLHITFLQKLSIGRYDASTNPGGAGTHDVYYMAIDTPDITNGPIGLKENANNLFSVAQNFPNPFRYHTSIPVNFNQSTDITIRIVDLVGKEIYNNQFGKIPAGSSQLDIKLGDLPAGIYIYSIEAEGYKVARKMIVE